MVVFPCDYFDENRVFQTEEVVLLFPPFTGNILLNRTDTNYVMWKTLVCAIDCANLEFNE